MTINHTGSTITLAYGTYRELERELERLRQQAANQTTLPTAELDDHVRDLHAAVEAALPIVQWAVGTLNPESHRGWPHDALKALGEALQRTARGDPHRTELALSFIHFARECRDVDVIRRERIADAQKVLTDENADGRPTEGLTEP